MANTSYLLGHSATEVHRLQVQAAVIQPITRRLFEAADLAPGMRVLDIGCGAGDVALLAAAMVGETGTVVGIDREPLVLETARRRARQAGFGNIEFFAGSIDDAAKDFDLVIGRYVLIHQEDPVTLVRAAAAHARSGGVVAFHEVVCTGPAFSAPDVPLWHDVWSLITTAFAARLKHPAAGSYLVQIFHEAGLDVPEIFCELPVGGGADCPLYEWIALTYDTLLPTLRSIGGSDRLLAHREDLATELRRSAVAARAQVGAGLQHCGWVRV